MSGSRAGRERLIVLVLGISSWQKQPRDKGSLWLQLMQSTKEGKSCPGAGAWGRGQSFCLTDAYAVLPCCLQSGHSRNSLPKSPCPQPNLCRCQSLRRPQVQCYIYIVTFVTFTRDPYISGFKPPTFSRAHPRGPTARCTGNLQEQPPHLVESLRKRLAR